MRLSSRLFPLLTQDPSTSLLEAHASSLDTILGVIEHEGTTSADPQLRVVSVCGLEHSGKKLLCHYLMRESLKADDMPLFADEERRHRNIGPSNPLKSTPNPRSSPREISRRRGIFFFLVRDPSKELHAMLSDKEFYTIDDELQHMLEEEGWGHSPPHELAHTENHSENPQQHVVAILMLRGLSTFLDPKSSSVRTRDRIFRKEDTSLTDAVDTALVHFAHLFSSQMIFNAPFYPHMQERDLTTLSSLMGMWNLTDRVLSWSRPETLQRIASTESVASSAQSPRKSSRRRKKVARKHTSDKSKTLKPRLRNLSLMPPKHHSLDKKPRSLSHETSFPTAPQAPTLLSISWSPNSLKAHEDYFRENAHELSEFIYTIRDVPQLNPINPERFLLDALLADPLSNTRRFNTITMRKCMKFLFPSTSAHIDNMDSLRRQQSDSDSSDEDEDKSIFLLPSVEANPFKGFQIFAPMHHAPHIDEQVWREVCRPFKNSLSRLKYYIFKNCKVKYFNGWPLTLQGLFCVASAFSDHVNTKSTFPPIQHLSEIYENQFILSKLEVKCIAFYKRKMRKLTMPCSQKEIVAHHSSIRPKLKQLILEETHRFPKRMQAVVRQRVFDCIGTMSETVSEELLRASETVEGYPCAEFGEHRISHQENHSQTIRSTTPLHQSLPAPNQAHNPHTPLSPHGDSIDPKVIAQKTLQHLTVAQEYELRNIVESRRKCKSIQYRIYARCVKSLKAYRNMKEYERDFQRFLSLYRRHKDLGPAKDLIAQEFQAREQGKVKLLLTLLTKKMHFSTLSDMEGERVSTLNHQLEQIEKNLHHSRMLQRTQEELETQRLEEETKNLQVMVFTESSTCTDQKMKSFANRKALIEFVDEYYSKGYFVHSIFFFKLRYGALMRRYRSPVAREKIILCQTHELRSTIVGVWNEGFKLVHSLCFDEIKRQWILVVRIQDEPNKPQNCKFVFESNASELKARVSRLCQKGFVLTVCSVSDADSLYFAYLILPEEDYQSDALFLTGPFKYVTHKMSQFVKNQYTVKVCCGDKKGNWFLFAQKPHIPTRGSTTQGASFVSLDYAAKDTQESTYLTPEAETFFKSFPQIHQVEEFVSDAFGTLSQAVSAMGSGGTSDDL
uniref:Uncharacterized protein n=1 Tax=Percolomonas cosmopolitus TaxID=63605 RepID=A0A7S1KTS2_9EUKA|mmetsp:Transcript_8028/g.29834  ORF Transcript_8028/g.29834 Transcript_8028/m.29834 type:complete len:1124 (+) Transcript_8028:80-3451(+)